MQNWLWLSLKNLRSLFWYSYTCFARLVIIGVYLMVLLNSFKDGCRSSVRNPILKNFRSFIYSFGKFTFKTIRNFFCKNNYLSNKIISFINFFFIFFIWFPFQITWKENDIFFLYYYFQWNFNFILTSIVIYSSRTSREKLKSASHWQIKKWNTKMIFFCSTIFFFKLIISLT